MKIQHSQSISSFGGINFVFEYLNELKIGSLFDSHLPVLAAQSTYSWRDIIYSMLSIYFCGGDHIEDLQVHLSPHFEGNPYIQLTSPDTLLRRLKQLSEDNSTCRTKRGKVDHVFNNNRRLAGLNVQLLKKLDVFSKETLTIDYDNTILFNEKSDSTMTYKRNPGYQPGVCIINEEQILYIENRNGNSDAKSFQADTLQRIFDLLKSNNVKKADHFRADAASYQYDVIKLLQEEVKNFYIGCRNDYVEKYFTEISDWQPLTDDDDNMMEVGEIRITPFQKQARDNNDLPREYRLIVKRKLKDDKQLDLFSQDAYEYRAILTNNIDLSAVEVAHFYNHRGNPEKQFDILKNDFGWKYMPFSKLNQNTVFLYLTAICRNLYHHIIRYFSKRIKFLKPTFRLKKFLFRFIILPAKWIRRARQNYLKIYGEIHFSP